MTSQLSMQNSADNMDAVAEDVSFEDCIAEGSHFEGAKLTRVSFTRCDLYWASFFGAELKDVIFDQCDLRGAVFEETRFDNCTFNECDVGTDALGGQTYFDNADLSSVRFVNCRGR